MVCLGSFLHVSVALPHHIWFAALLELFGFVCVHIDIIYHLGLLPLYGAGFVVALGLSLPRYLYTFSFALPLCSINHAD